MYYKYFLTLLLFIGIHHAANANFVFNPNSIEAFHALFDLRFNDAKKIIREEKLNNPQNGIPVLLENYLDYLFLLTSENASEFEKFKNRKSGRIDAIKKNDKNSPYYLFAQAEIYLQSGMIKAKFGEYMSSNYDFKKAKDLLKENNEKYKDFLPNQKSLGLIEVIFGAIPANMKGIASVLGIEGNITKGTRQLERFRLQLTNSKFNYYKDEIVFLLCFTNLDVIQARNSYSYLTPLLNGMNEKSLLKTYLQAYTAFRTGHADAAIKFIEAAPIGSQYAELPLMNYLMGNAKLCRMDSDANLYLNKFVNETLSTNYIKDTYLRLAFYYLIRNNISQYNYYLNLVRTKGSVINEKDKQALKEANDLKPNLVLLKARLYFDGGGYSHALGQLKSIQINELKSQKDKLEYHYRFARTYDMMNNFEDALWYYQRTINLGKSQGYYFAAYLALKSGNIYEHLKDHKKAAEYYHMALGMKNHEYQIGIDTQAKEGLRRINE
ncbi:MAG: tetratricopeptide repeat protein [Bacteroidetes bacterium]|nr:tetratricopeptide repeat protein [Bacteroidota bacterium]